MDSMNLKNKKLENDADEWNCKFEKILIQLLVVNVQCTVAI